MWTIEKLDEIEARVQTPRDIYMYRRDLLQNHQPGFAAMFVPLMQKSLELWFALLEIPNAFSVEESWESNNANIDKSSPALCDARPTKTLFQMLSIHLAISRKDPVLAEELGRQGSHAKLSKLIQYDATSHPEQEQDTIMDLQDLCCEIASNSGSFPLKVAPITNLAERMPLCISFSAAYTVLIQQVTFRQSAQHDVGFVLWPSAVALSQWLIDNPEFVVMAKTILELGAGCGLAGIVAGMLVQERNQASITNIILTDFNQIVLDNLKLNVELNGIQASVRKLDFYQQSGCATCWFDGDGVEHDQVDLILAADMICQPTDAVASANAVHDSLRSGGKAIVICGNGKHRFGVDCFEAECKRVGLMIETSCVTLDMESLHLAAGYVDGMSLTMFSIDKP